MTPCTEILIANTMNKTLVLATLFFTTIFLMFSYQTLSKEPMGLQSNTDTHLVVPLKLATSGINVPDNKILINDSFVESTFSRWLTRDPSDDMLTVEPAGRLGNLMFEYASLLGIAFRNGKRPFIKPYNTLNTVFNLSFVENRDTKYWLHISETKYAGYSPEFGNLPAGNYVIGQFLQSWKYFEPFREQIKNEFRFSDNYEMLRKNIFHLYTSSFLNRTLIGLHVRRTDMTQQNELGYTEAPLSYIYKAVQHMREKFRNPVFLIATDDKEWCRRNLNSGDMILMTTTNPFVDFGTLVLCDHMIITVGTFGWWAAWLINGYTVYYKDYPKTGGKLGSQFVKEDYFMPHWIPMSG